MTSEPATAAPQAIPRVSLHEEIVDRLREMIFDGDLVPGERVPERSLCAQFAISRTPLREALKVLASEGLLTLLPNRGARVTQLTADDVDELFPVMGALEALAGELACQYITDEGIAKVRALHYQMALHHTRGERREYFRLNQEIHAKIIEAAGNPTLANVYRNLAGRIRRARYVANSTSERWNEAMREHEEILHALETRDSVCLSGLLKQHLPNTRDAVKAVLQTEASSL